MNIFKFQNLKRALLFIPFLLACFSNLIAFGLDGAQTTGITMTSGYLSLFIIYHYLESITILPSSKINKPNSYLDFLFKAN